MGSQLDRRLLRGAFALGIALRVVLALVNTDANDNHLAVVEILASENRLPAPEEAYVAYHPPLYHAAAALLWKLAPTDSPYVLIRLAQLLNTAAGIWTLAVFRRVLLRSGVGERAAALTFALAALNPKLIAIQSQATNDAFVILLGTLALEAAWRYFEAPSRGGLVRLTACAALAPLAKANGFVIVAALAGVFVLAWIWGRPQGRRATLLTGGAFTALSLIIPLLLGPYGRDWLRRGSPFVSNMQRSPPAPWTGESPDLRPGATSVAGALGTFRLLGMLEQPQITNGERDYPLHRTSLWSQVYGRWHFAHFDNWPPTWQTSGPAVLWLGRLILLAALPVTALGLAGLGRRTWAALWRFEAPGEAAAVLAAWGALAALAWYAMAYRDFSTMKPIFVFPALLGFVWGLAWQLDRRQGPPATAMCLTLCALYAADAAWLSGHLLAAKLPMLLELF